MALIIAFANHKGGVAKTASVAALGTIFAREGFRVLMVDLDTQANLTYSFIDMATNAPSRFLYDAIRERKDLPQVAVRDNLYIVPSGLYMTIVEREMQNMRRKELVLHDLIMPIEGNYDLILLDCPPALNNITDNALIIADRLSVPVLADQLSYNGLKMIETYLPQLADLNPDIRINDIFFTMYGGRTNLDGTLYKVIHDEFPEQTMETKIHATVRVKESVSALMSIVEYAPRCTAAKDYEDLAKELADRLNKMDGKKSK